MRSISRSGLAGRGRPGGYCGCEMAWRAAAGPRRTQPRSGVRVDPHQSHPLQNRRLKTPASLRFMELI